MPIYEFKCAACSHEFEELCSMGQASMECPKCASQNTQRKISVFAAQSKGAEGTKAISGGHSCGSCHGSSCSTCH